LKLPRYEYTTDPKAFNYFFESIGTKGKIKKMVQYSPMQVEGFYNLAFGDYNEKTDEIDDQIITNNGDARKVLATVVSTVYAFTGMYPNSKIFATGSNEARTRLYRMGISTNLEEIKEDFLVFGLNANNLFEEFIVGEDYYGFLVTRKEKLN
jgi:hypothetical protein